MPEYRRPKIAGATYFLTLVTHERRPLFADAPSVDILRQSLAATRRERPFQIDAAVILADHMHFLWTIPDGDASTRVGRFKVLVTRALRPLAKADGENTDPRNQRRESNVWQRRFWDHVIRDDGDFRRHLDYIHYNPVKHGYASCPHAWQASSFAAWVAKGAYEDDWGCQCAGQTVLQPTIADLETGE